MADQTTIAPNVPTTTNSLSVQAIDGDIYRIVKEMARVVSSRLTAITEDDKIRFDAYFVKLNDLIETTTASMSDFHYLAEMPLRDIDEASALVENPAIQASMNHLIGTDINLRISPSSRGNDSLTPQDKADLVDGVAKAQTYINDFYSSNNPLDFNQSAPDKPIVNPMQLPTS